jgi:hypothetical protein
LKITGPVRYPLGLREEKIASLLGRIGLGSSRSDTRHPLPKKDEASA